MSQAILANQMRRGVGAANSFLRWWLAELNGLVPDQIRSLRSRRRGAFTLDLCPEGVICGFASAQQYQQLARVNGDALEVQRRTIAKAVGECPRAPTEIVVRLRPDQVLQKAVSIPLAAHSELRQVLEFDLGRQIPLVPDEVYFDFHILEKRVDEQRLIVELVAVPRATIEHTLAMIRDWGLTVDRIGLADQGEEAWLYNFLPRDRTRRRMPRIRRTTIGVWALAGVLCCGVVAEKFHHDDLQLKTMAAEIAAVKPVADDVFRLRVEIQRIAAQQRFIPDKRQSPPVLEVLNELTRVLPDNTWVFNLDINGAELRADGFSPAASRLISVLDGSPLFANARFRSSVTQGIKPGTERFEVSCDIRRMQ